MTKQPAFVEQIVPVGSVRESLYWWQVRRKVRYFCFRLQTEHDPEAPDRPAPEDIPKGFRAFYEKQTWFDGWRNFGVTWDVGGADSDFAEAKMEHGSDSPLVTVPRWLSVWEENEDEIGHWVRTGEIEARKRRRSNGSQSNVQSRDSSD
jgi:hypothetical protein